MQKRKMLSLLLALTMVFTCIPVGMFAEGEDTVEEAIEIVVAEPVVEEKIEEAAPVVEKIEEPAPAPVVEEKVEEPAPSSEEPAAESVVGEPATEPVVETTPAEETPVEEKTPVEEEPVAEPVEETAEEPAEQTVEENPAEEPAEETPAEELAQEDEEPASQPEEDSEDAEESTTETEDAVDAFQAGLAYLSAGDVFADEKLKETAGTVNDVAVVYAIARVKDEGDLSKNEVIRFVMNVDGEIKTLYVKYGRLTALDEDQVNAYMNSNHNDGVDYRYVTLDQADFTAVVVEEVVVAEEVEATEETVEVTEEAPATDEPEAIETVIESIEVVSVTPVAITEVEDAAEEENTVDIAIVIVGNDDVDETVESAYEPWQAVVTLTYQDTIAIRKEAKAGGDELFKCQNGEQVTVLSEDGAWAFISAAGGEGYIMLKFLAKAEAKTEDEAEESAEVEEIEEVVFGEIEEEIAVEAADSAIIEEVEFEEEGETVEVEVANASSSSITIKQQPVCVAVAIGETAIFSVDADGDELTYQWQISTTNGEKWSNTSTTGAKSDTVSVKLTNAKVRSLWRCVISDADGNSVTTASALLSLKTFEITQQPKDAAVAIGETASFTVEATGTGLNYQWQISTNNGAKWSNTTTTGAKTETVSVKLTAAKVNSQWRCVITDADGNQAISDAVTLGKISIVIDEQPKDTAVAIGETATFTVAATGTGLSYQWQISTTNGEKWSNTTVTGAKTQTVSVKLTAAKVNSQWRCVITDGDGNQVISDVATLGKISSPSIVIDEQPKDTAVVIGDTATFTVAATGTGLSYQWQISTTNGEKWSNTTVTGAKTETVSVKLTAAKVNSQWRCVITDADGNQAISDAATLGKIAIVIDEQPKDTAVAIGETATFTVEATGTGLSYQWQISTNNGEKWSNTTTTGAKTETVSVKLTAAKVNSQWRCIITDADGNQVISDAATLAKAAIVITEQPKDASAFIGDTATFTAVATGTGLGYQWQISTNNGEKWSNTTTTGAKTETVSVKLTATKVNSLWRCVITDGDGNQVISDAATLSETTEFELDEVVYGVIEAGKVEVKLYNGTSSNVTIPEKVNGFTVTKVGESAFENKNNLVSIDLPDTITVIGKRAFAGCSSLKEMK